MTLRASREFAEQFDTTLAAWDEAQSTERVWSRDGTLWTGDAAKWLGWIDAPFERDGALAGMAERARRALTTGACDVLLIGMGGSSLAPEVIAAILPPGRNACRLRVLDSTHPAAVRAVLDATDWPRTSVVVASKSGTTLEPDVLLAVALAHAERELGEQAPSHFIAITDPGSKLEQFARAQGFADVFHGVPSIGGRFSALSANGLVHVAHRGLDPAEFLRSARDMSEMCKLPALDNPGVALGAFLATAARGARDKCTLLLPPSLAPIGAWIEQLVAESTGKRGQMVLPVDGETIGDVSVYGGDRAFVHVRVANDAGAAAHEAAADAFAAAGHPVLSFDVGAAADLAGEFFRWEFATAVTGSLMGLNPFDQPDVEASKVATRALTDARERGDAPVDVSESQASLRDVLTSIAPGDYVGILAFLPMLDDVVAALQRTRMRIRDARGCATTLGFGPRFLHSTGQAFKGGPNTGVFIQLTWESPDDIAIPGRQLSLGTVVSAQAQGDRAVLRARGRRVHHVPLSGPLSEALALLDAEVAAALE
jgi:glucose-6-phosphate isomerase